MPTQYPAFDGGRSLCGDQPFLGCGSKLAAGRLFHDPLGLIRSWDRHLTSGCLDDGPFNDNAAGDVLRTRPGAFAPKRRWRSCASGCSLRSTRSLNQSVSASPVDGASTARRPVSSSCVAGDCAASRRPVRDRSIRFSPRRRRQASISRDLPSVVEVAVQRFRP